MNKKIHIVALLLVALFAVVALGLFLKTDSVHPIVKMDEGWEVYMDETLLGVTAKEQPLRDLIKTAEAGDTVILKRILTQPERVEFPAIQFCSRYCAYMIYLDGRMVCSGGFERLSEGKYIGREYHLVSLPSQLAGKEMEVRLTLSEATDRNPFVAVCLGDYADLETYFTHRLTMPLTIGAFLIFFGMFFFMITLLVFVDLRQFGVHGYAALLCILMGVMLHFYCGLDMLYMDPVHGTTGAYLAIWLQIPVVMQMVYRVPGMLHASYYRAVEILCIAVTAIVIMLHFVGGRFFNQTVPVFFLAAVVGYVTVLLDFAYNKKQGKLGGSAQIFLAAVVICITAQLFAGGYLRLIVRGFVDRSMNTRFLGSTLFCVGPLLFAYYMLVNYLFNATDSYAKEREYASLTRLAYSDGLTNLPNRSKLDAYLDQLEDKKMDYCIISMDVNGLKKVNDTYGHVAGDTLLQDFAGVLRASMEMVDEGICGRIGGDEFMIVLDRGGKADKLIEKIQEGMEELNAKGEHPWPYSVAAGFALRSECAKGPSEDIVHATYLLADQRMYEMKRKQHGRVENG